jgi:hypothetical protein
MQVQLSPGLFEYLLKGNFISQREQSLLMGATRTGESYLIELADDDADVIRDACGEHLQRVGFDADYNPTAEGAMLEQLIDLFLVRRSG